MGGASKNRGTPKWMVYNGKTWKTPIKIHDLVVPLFLEVSFPEIERHSYKMSDGLSLILRLKLLGEGGNGIS